MIRQQISNGISKTFAFICEGESDSGGSLEAELIQHPMTGTVRWGDSGGL
jgi:hypothetical protein